MRIECVPGYTHIDWATLMEQYAKARSKNYEIVRVPLGQEDVHRVGTRTCRACGNKPPNGYDTQWKIANLLDNIQQQQEAHNLLLQSMLGELKALKDQAAREGPEGGP